MASFADVCRFTAASSGTGDFVVSAAVLGYQTPASAQAVNAAIYKYRAESADLTQWECGYGAYTVAGTTLARTTVLFNSAGTTAKISFTAAPQVAIVAYGEDLDPVDGQLFGLTLSTAGASTTFSVATGWAADSTAVNILRLYAAVAKTTSAWAVGTGNGGLDTGSIAASTWYHTHIIKRLDTGVTDVLVSLSATSPTMPTNYTLFRRIGSMKTNGSSQWTLFQQSSDTFLWDVPIQDVAATNPGTAAVTRTLTVPTGVVVEAIYSVADQAVTSNHFVLMSPLSLTDQTPSSSIFSYSAQAGGTGITSFTAGGQFRTLTNASAQIRSRASASGASDTFTISTTGWIDTRGRTA